MIDQCNCFQQVSTFDRLVRICVVSFNESILDGSPAEVLFAPHVLTLMSPIRSEQHLLVDSCESSFLWLESGIGCVRLVKSQSLRCHSGGMYRIHSFENDQIHIRDLENDSNAWTTCALQVTPFFSHCPLK